MVPRVGSFYGAASVVHFWTSRMGKGCHSLEFELRSQRRSAPFVAQFRSRAMLTREDVEIVLNQIRPFLHADGGDIELIGVDQHSAVVRLTGMCAGCPSAHMTLSVGVEAALRNALPEFRTLRHVGGD